MFDMNKIEAVELMDLDGTLNELAKVPSVFSKALKMNLEKDIFLESEAGNMSSIYLTHFKLLKMVFEILADNNVLLLIASQRISYLEDVEINLHNELFEVLDRAFGDNRRYFNQEISDAMGAKINIMGHIKNSKNNYFEAARKVLAEKNIEIPKENNKFGLTDDDKGVLKSANNGGYQTTRADRQGNDIQSLSFLSHLLFRRLSEDKIITGIKKHAESDEDANLLLQVMVAERIKAKQPFSSLKTAELINKRFLEKNNTLILQKQRINALERFPKKNEYLLIHAKESYKHSMEAAFEKFGFDPNNEKIKGYIDRRIPTEMISSMDQKQKASLLPDQWQSDSKRSFFFVRSKYTRDIDNTLKQYRESKLAEETPQKLYVKLIVVEQAAKTYLKDNKKGRRNEAVIRLLENIHLEKNKVYRFGEIDDRLHYSIEILEEKIADLANPKLNSSLLAYNPAPSFHQQYTNPDNTAPATPLKNLVSHLKELHDELVEKFQKNELNNNILHQGEFKQKVSKIRSKANAYFDQALEEAEDNPQKKSIVEKVKDRFEQSVDNIENHINNAPGH